MHHKYIVCTYAHAPQTHEYARVYVHKQRHPDRALISLEPAIDLPGPFNSSLLSLHWPSRAAADPHGLQCYVVQWPVLWKVKSEDPCHSSLWSSQITLASNEQKEGDKNKMFLTWSNKNMEWSQAYFCAFSYIDALKSAVPCSLPSKCYSHHMVQHNHLTSSPAQTWSWFCMCLLSLQACSSTHQCVRLSVRYNSQVNGAGSLENLSSLDSNDSPDTCFLLFWKPKIQNQSTTNWHFIRVIDKELTSKSHPHYQQNTSSYRYLGASTLLS